MHACVSYPILTLPNLKTRDPVQLGATAEVQLGATADVQLGATADVEEVEGPVRTGEPYLTPRLLTLDAPHQQDHAIR